MYISAGYDILSTVYIVPINNIFVANIILQYSAIR